MCFVYLVHLLVWFTVCLQEKLLCFNQKASAEAGMRCRSETGKEMGPAEVSTHGGGDTGGKASQATHELSAPGP